MNGTPESRKSESAPSASQPILTSREKLTQEKVRELFDYSESGCLLWKHTNRNVVAKEIAGTIRGKGYRQVMVDGKNYYSHRLVLLYHNGYLPENNVDHINRERQTSADPAMGQPEASRTNTGSAGGNCYA